MSGPRVWSDFRRMRHENPHRRSAGATRNPPNATNSRKKSFEVMRCTPWLWRRRQLYTGPSIRSAHCPAYQPVPAVGPAPARRGVWEERPDRHGQRVQKLHKFGWPSSGVQETAALPTELRERGRSIPPRLRPSHRCICRTPAGPAGMCRLSFVLSTTTDFTSPRSRCLTVRQFAARL
jgi:hypothetical protein